MVGSTSFPYFADGVNEGNILKKGVSNSLDKVTAIPESLIVDSQILSTFTSDAPISEPGQTLHSCTFSWTYNRNTDNPTSQQISPTIGAVYVGDRNVNAVIDITDTTTFTITAIGDDGTASSKDTTLYFRWKRYWNVWDVNNDGVPNNNDIVSLFNSESGTSRVVSKTFDASINTPPYNLVYAYPKSWGLPTSTKIGGLSFTDYTVAEISGFTNASGGTTDYYVIYTNTQTSASSVTWEIES